MEAYDLDQLAADITGLADHFGDLRFPLGEVRRDLEGDPRTLHAPQLPAFGEQRSDDSGVLQLGRRKLGEAPPLGARRRDRR